MCFFFFFQAEDGIRDIGVTGVQTCALPITALDARPSTGKRPSSGRPADRSAAVVAGSGTRPIAERRPADPSAPSASERDHILDVDLSVDLGRGLILANPILVASGPFGYGVEYGDVVDVDRLAASSFTGATRGPRV